MSTQDLERQLAVVLKQHAEDTMNRTETRTALETLIIGAEQDLRRRRSRTWAAGALVAAAATIALIVAATNLLFDRQDTVEPVDVPTPAERVATGFLDAWASFDQHRAAAYLADDADLTALDPWRRTNRWYDAMGFRMLHGSCEQQASATAETTVVCTFQFHALGSDELGLGPFPSETFTFAVKDGTISTVLVSRYALTGEPGHGRATNGFSEQVWEPFGAWVGETYPDDAEVMYATWPYLSDAVLTDRSIALWAKHTRDYVNEQK